MLAISLKLQTKPMIFDADTGGKTEHFEFTVRSLERVGALVIEDKTGPCNFTRK